jgi:hypothetical protein
VNTAKVGTSLLLLLAVGPFLLLAPWWPLPALVVAPLLVLAAVYLMLFASVAYKRRAKRELSESTSPSEPDVQWQAGRWDTDPRHAYLANVGDVAAYDVSVTLSDGVTCTAEFVPPFCADQLSSSGVPCYVNLSIRQRIRSSATAAVQSRGSANPTTDLVEVDVHVRWRTDSGEWHVQNVRVG